MPEQFDPTKLADIYLPETISLWPLAPAWWFLLAGIIVLIALIIYWLKRVPKIPAPTRKELKSQALQELLAIKASYESQAADKGSKEIVHETVKKLSVFLRRYALSLYPRDQVASITDERWLVFLDRLYSGDAQSNSNPKPLFSKKFAVLLTQVPYQSPHSEIDTSLIDELFRVSESLIKNTYQLYKANMPISSIPVSNKESLEQKHV
ncbi:DUF4381 domain-containing protein [sulfur-oxidizing endosymbiont of Gigantopelta aegis]|uniref:DUF4381 domain-containing protein n=1 Tax=sulfur-oxidizing endosymbiont of Gigantopelta aegis TaxID=2794934 RepID=UPI0018DB55A1|nr:DUF4381 domain-containing protein [sulfur-oxidizing endosymbiont of Gigantopelta aegis]